MNTRVRLTIFTGIMLLGAASTFSTTCHTLSAGAWNDLELWDCGCNPSTCDTLVVAHAMTTDADTLHIPGSMLVVEESGSLSGEHFSIAADVFNHGTMNGSWMRFFGEGAFVNYGMVNAVQLLAIQDSCINHGLLQATDSLVIGYFKILKNHGEIDCNVLYNLSYFLNVEPSSLVFANRDEGNTLENWGEMVITGDLYTYTGFENRGTVRTGSLLTRSLGFQNRGLIICEDTLSNGTGVYAPSSLLHNLSRIETNHLVNREGCQLRGSGTLCISGTSINHGSIRDQLEICDTSPTTTEWPFLDVNTGTVENFVDVCTPGICAVGLVERTYRTDLLAYPNPASGAFTVELGGLSTAAYVVLLDMQGRLVKTMPCAGMQQCVFPADEVPSGAYRVSVRDVLGAELGGAKVVMVAP